MLLAIFCAIICMAFFTLADLSTQILQVEEGYSTQQVIHVRMTGNMVLCLTYLWWTKTPHAPWGHKEVRPLLWARGVMGYISLSTGYVALNYLPLGEGVTMYSLKPFPVMLLCYVFLRERVSIIQGGAAVVSTFAVVMIAFPQMFGADIAENTEVVFATEGWPRVLGYILGFTQTMAEAFCALIIRTIGHKSTPMQTLTMYTVVCAFGPYIEIVFTRTLPPVPATTRGWFALLGIIPSGMAGQLCETYALQNMPAALAVMLSYSGIIFANLAQWLFYHDHPTTPGFIGMGLICLAGWAAVAFPPQKQKAEMECTPNNDEDDATLPLRSFVDEEAQLSTDEVEGADATATTMDGYKAEEGVSTARVVTV